ncbi:hypothetical protein SESBI_37977 [Sesbania bispinosa]|nr:hypothetical protein SESBI_37977 [Sesbania bispinosa]
MQALSILSMPHSFVDIDGFAPIHVNLDLDFNAKNNKDQIRHDLVENLGDQQEFSFASTDSQGTLSFADEIFDNGRIRPIFPSFDQSFLFTTTPGDVTSPLRPPLKKLFIEQCNKFCSKPSGTLRESDNDPLQNKSMVEVEASSKRCKKSNSTGFSKLWRFRRGLSRRSNSDGKDAFVFLNSPMPVMSDEKRVENAIVKKGKGEKPKKALSAHEKLYVMNRTRKESNKRKSFLPYRQQLVGLFANVNGFSRNLHPF